ncbi:IreB family regulatory phosphoprotein, partial [Lawsonibacter sp.]
MGPETNEEVCRVEMDYTRKFSIQNEKDPEIKEILSCVYSSLQEKGYNP